MSRLLLLLTLAAPLAPASVSCAEESAVILPADYFDQLDAEQAVYQQTLDKLEQPVSCDFVDTPLIEAVKFLGQKAGVEIRLDRNSLENLGLSVDLPVTLSLQDVRLKTVLRLLRTSIGDGRNVNYVIDGERIIFFSQDEIEQKLRIAYYPCADLLYDASHDGPKYDNLINAITSCIAMYTWEEIGGAGVIQPQSNGLVISQTEDTHHKIVALLAALRKAKAIPSDKYDPAPIDVVGNADVDEKVRQKLQANLTDVDFQNTSLTSIVRLLSDQCHVQIVINEGALASVGMSPDAEITDHWEAATAETILRDVCRAVDGDFVGRDDLIEITTTQRLEKDPQLRLYPVRDLLTAKEFEQFEQDSDMDRFELRLMRYDSLIETLTSNIVPASWEELGGDGVCYPVGVADVLAVSQTPANHQQVERLLATIRRQRQESPEKPQAEAESTAPLVISYPLEIEGGEEAMKAFSLALSEEIEPGSWDGEQHYVRIAGNRLLVKQTPQTQRRVRRWLDQVLQIAPPKKIPVHPANQGGTF